MKKPSPTLWFTGLSSAGKSTLSIAVQKRLSALGYRAEILDGDIFRAQYCRDLGFSRPDREENIRRLCQAAHALNARGVIALVAAISPYRASRDIVRQRLNNLVEIFVNAPLEICEARDRKGLYKRARAGELRGVTGIDDPYEAPINPAIECRTDLESIQESVRKIVDYIQVRGSPLSGWCPNGDPLAFRALRVYPTVGPEDRTTAEADDLEFVESGSQRRPQT